MRDNDWLGLILVVDAFLVIFGPPLASMTAGAGQPTIGLGSFAAGLITFGISDGSTGLAQTFISAIFYIMNGFGVYLIAGMIRGVKG